MTELNKHELIPGYEFRHIQYSERPILDRAGAAIDGLHQIVISLDNPKQLNSYTTDAVREVIMAVRRAIVERAATNIIFTATGTRSFCTGGNTEEYATYYSQRPHEYLQYMRLFNDMVTAFLLADKPVICRVNGMRIAGGQEIGMACDFSIAGDHARFGQAGPLHGSAPDGGSTDFLDLYVGFSNAGDSLALCDQWSAHKAYRIGLINEIAPVYRRKDTGEMIPNPMVVSDRFVDGGGRIVYGDFKTGRERDDAKALIADCEIDLTALDAAVDAMATKLVYTFPDCTRKTLESLRKKKLRHWQANCETNRSWLSLNMSTEAAAGFRAFNEGARGDREIDFISLRKQIAAGSKFDQDLIDSVQPKSAKASES